MIVGLAVASVFLFQSVVWGLETTDPELECASSTADEPIFYPWIQRTYVLQEGLCGTANPELVTIHSGRIEGSDFWCDAAAALPGAGTGMAAFDVVCLIDGESTAGELVLDLGNAADHFSLLLPGLHSWFSLYTCDNPHILKPQG